MDRRDYHDPAFLLIEATTMATIEMRELHLVKKALAVAVLVMERQKGPFQSSNDILDMKLLLERLTDTTEMEHYMRSAQIAVTGMPPPERD